MFCLAPRHSAEGHAWLKDLIPQLVWDIKQACWSRGAPVIILHDKFIPVIKLIAQKPFNPEHPGSEPWVQVRENDSIMAFSVYLDHTDVVNKLFAIEIKEEGVEPDWSDLIVAAGVAGDSSIAALATLLCSWNLFIFTRSTFWGCSQIIASYLGPFQNSPPPLVDYVIYAYPLKECL